MSRQLTGVSGPISRQTIDRSADWKPYACVIHTSKWVRKPEVFGENVKDPKELLKAFSAPDCHLCCTKRKRVVTVIAKCGDEYVQVGLDCFEHLWDPTEAARFKRRAKKRKMNALKKGRELQQAEQARTKAEQARIDRDATGGSWPFDD